MASSSVEDPEYEDDLEEKENKDLLENLPLTKSLVRMRNKVRNGGKAVNEDAGEGQSCSCVQLDTQGARESPARSARTKDKRGRPSKGNTRKDKRKMRDKRKSAGLVYLKSTGEVGVSI